MNELENQMSIRAQLQADMKTAMKTKDNQTRDTLRLLLAAVKQVEVDERTTLDDAGIMAVLTKQAKQRRESIAEYEKANREDLAAVEKADLVVIERYLPEMMSREELHALVTTVVTDLGVTDLKAMGQVMAKLMPEVKGKADGRVVSDVVREILQN